MTRKHAHDRRPYIRDAAAFDEPPPAGFVATATIGMVVLALAVGFVIGFAVDLVMNLFTWLTALLWNGATGDTVVPWFSLAVCALGGVLIGVWTWWSNNRVKPLEEVMAEFKATGSYKTNGVWKPVVTFLLPLVFGGSIGFEAGLTGLITAGCCWIRDRLKAAGLLKALVTPMCLNMGWIGGNFFPSIFAGVAAGYGLAALTGADPMLMVTVTTTAHLAGVIRKPLLVLAILFLCFPAEGVLWMGLAAIIGAALPVPRVLLAANAEKE